MKNDTALQVLQRSEALAREDLEYIKKSIEECEDRLVKLRERRDADVAELAELAAAIEVFTDPREAADR